MTPSRHYRALDYDRVVHNRRVETDYFARVPVFQALSARLDATDKSRIDHYVAAAFDLFEEPTWLQPLSEHWLERVDTPDFAGPAQSVGQHGFADAFDTAVLFSHADMIVAAQTMDSDITSLVRADKSSEVVLEVMGRTTVFRICGPGEIEIELFECDDVLTENSDLAAPATMHSVGIRVVTEASGAFAVDGRHSAFRILSSTGNPMFLSASVLRGALSYRASVRFRDGKILRTDANSLNDNGIRVMITVLNLLGAEGRHDAILRFVSHPSFFVRFHAIRQFMVCTGGAALPVVEKALEVEANPSVRRGLTQLRNYILTREYGHAA